MKKLTIFKKTLILSLGLLIFSCNDNESIDLIDSEAIQETVTMYDHMDELTVTKMDNGDYRLGDIVYPKGYLTEEPTEWPTLDLETPPSVSSEKSASSNSAGLWANNTVVYQLNNNLNRDYINLIDSAMRSWSSKTNIKFKRRTDESTYVHIYYDSKQNGTAFATLGAARGGVVAIGSGADLTLLIHELGHTFGLVHEQTRSDRDDYIDIYWQYINNEHRHNFYKSNNVRSLTSRFDYNSIMLYQSHFFSNTPGKYTILDKKGYTLGGAQRSISTLDAQGMNVLYPSSSNNNSSQCSGVSAWRSGVTYQLGSKITYNGVLYQLRYSNGYYWFNLGSC
ncbi:M12 family metallopeptidase [uncultured Polaribacter sp.]|uniref:M12 family metallopeptidase n=1 Tax=uncultured Polaribacter sp. TaxID=174711 RepID=UPI00261D6454|nr:M12 family metallopeptidase [uncultured Polaribacter sp.]